MRTKSEHLAALNENPDDRRHGTSTGFAYGCRCGKCREWAISYSAKLRKKRGQKSTARNLTKKCAKKDICTLDALMLPMMGKPSIGSENHTCCVCGKPATDKHHIVRRGAGKLVVNGREVEKPTVRLCGCGNASGCHGLAHQSKLHFRWVEVTTNGNNRYLSVQVGGHWEYLITDEPTKYQDALAMDGWGRL